jgi:uncharacterized membrane-anchored protein YhcB (DUF1043 family)
MAVFGILCLIVAIILFYFGGKRLQEAAKLQNNYTKEIDLAREELSKIQSEKEKILIDKSILLNEISTKKDELYKTLEDEKNKLSNEMKKYQSNTSYAAEQYMYTLEKRYVEVEREFDEKMKILTTEEEDAKAELAKLKATLSAGVEAQLREREKEENLEYYKLKINSNDLSDKISFFSALFKIETFEKFGLLDGDLLESCKVENEFCKRIINGKHKVTLNLTSFVNHKCRNLNYRESSQIHSFKKMTLANMMNMEIKNQLNTSSFKKNYVIYTFVHEYGELPKIESFDPDADYVCFTTSERIAGNENLAHPWKIFNVNTIIDALEYSRFDKKIEQLFKINPHLFFSNYNISIYIDANKIYDIHSNTKDYTRLIDPKHFLLALNSCEEDCVYREIIKSYKNNQIKSDSYNNLISLYRDKYRFPQHAGLIEDSILIRKHNDPRCKETMNKIWNFALTYNVQEKFFMNLSLWYFKYAYSSIPATLFYKKYVKLIEGK